MAPSGKSMIHLTFAVKTCANRNELIQNVLKGAVLDGKTLKVTDPEAFRECLPTLVANVADFGAESASGDVQALAAWIVGEAAQQLGAKLNSPQEVYVAIAEGKIAQNICFPAVNVRGNSLDTARALFRAAVDNKVGALIVEIARSEMGYTGQPPMEFAAVIQAAAVLEGFAGPVFLQGDHVQLKSKPVRQGGEAAKKEIAAHSDFIRELLSRGFGSIDLDMSPFERRNEEGLSFEEQQEENARMTAEKIAFVRETEKDLGIPWTTMLGGETGEVGKMNTREEDLDAYAKGILKHMERLGIDSSLGIRKIAVNDGTAHGGVPLPGGGVADVSIAFDVLSMASRKGREFGWAGAVQHGASTLPPDAFGLFPRHGAVEVHLATGFQNILYEHAFKVEGLQSQVERFLVDNFIGEWKPQKTFVQFAYSTRKKVLGPMKRTFWTLPEDIRAAAAEELYDQFTFLFEQLGVWDTRDLIAQYVTDHDFHPLFPEEGQTTRKPADAGDDSELSD
jgi:fructose/tagatose bisphosphate aldolase